MPRNLEGCELVADVIAARTLEGGRADRCTAWPVMKVAVPITPDRCARAQVEVAYAEAGGNTAEAVIANGVSVPERSDAATCVAAPDVIALVPTPSDGTTIVRDSKQGFVDLSVGVQFPD